jgi:ubiquinone/menaquinone biosynthesis C-methylase UbiE
MGVTTSWGGLSVSPPFQMLWSAYARVYDGLLEFYPYCKLVDAVVDRLHLTNGLRLLDIGCGTGNVMVKALARAAITIHGVDATPAMVARARRKLAMSIRRQTAVVTCGEAIATMQSLPAGSFDRVCLINVLYAVPDREALWRQCMRLLTPAGHIVVTTSTKSGTLPLIREHVRNAPRWYWASPRLLGVCFFDGLICALASAGRFTFPAEDVLYAEVIAAGGVPEDGQRTYGGEAEGVNLIFTVRHQSLPQAGVSCNVQ